MKILFFNYEYPPLGGGAANATFYILQEYARISGLEVDLVTSSIDEKYHLEKIGDNINIHRLPIGKNKTNLHFQSQKELIIYSWKAYFFAWKLIRKNRYSLTHSFFSVPCGFLSAVFKIQFGLPYIISLRGSDVPGYSDRFGLMYTILTPIIKFIWARADAVISNSDGLRDLALKVKSNQAIDIIYNGIDTQQFKPKSGEGDATIFKIICVSRLTKRKGIDYLLTAISKIVMAGHERIILYLVGEGNTKGDLEKQSAELGIEDFVKFSGRIAHDDLPEIYNSADVFVLPSLNEGMSNTMLEALASGLPLIATDTGGTKELVKDGINGFVVKMEDSDDLAEKIMTVMNGSELRKEMAAESRKMAEDLNWQSVAQKYFALYQKVSKNEK